MIADGKRRYETTPESLDSIALDFSSNRSTLRNVAKRENWKRYVPPPRGLSRAAEIAGKAEALEAEALAALSSPSPESGMSPSEEAAAPPTALGKAWSMRERIDELRAAVDGSPQCAPCARS